MQDVLFLSLLFTTSYDLVIPTLHRCDKFGDSPSTRGEAEVQQTSQQDGRRDAEKTSSTRSRRPEAEEAEGTVTFVRYGSRVDFR